ncbi:AAA family ATPase [Mucilaginibacter sp.]|uniref:AAA family ATPase n=1 Tax=Mucilaginibacter sp. TaxID=1882438 RepID=UPI003266F7D5
MISSIYLGEDKFEHYNTIEEDRTLKNLSKVNIFIGSNNSGKSRCLRTVFSNELLKYTTDQIDLSKINSLIKNFKQEIEDALNGLPANGQITERFIEKFEQLDFVNVTLNLTPSVNRFFQDLASYDGAVNTQYNSGGLEIRNALNIIGRRYTSQLNALIKNKVFNFKLDNVYIPTLRGLRNINGIDNDLFSTCTIRDYFTGSDFGTNIKNQLYTGLSLYKDTQKLLLGDKDDRNKVRAFELFLQQTFFNNQEINLIPRIGKEVVYFRIGEYEEHPIYELGDGIQSIIILTYPLFFRQGEKLNFFIEEPEQYLHPGFQRTFIETLLSPRFKDFQYFITTHSNHLLDLTLDKEHISIYTFKKKYTETNAPNFIIENVENEDSNILASIGVRNSSVFLSNCTIWVEGITDRIYIRKYLEIYQKSQVLTFKEDLHFSFVEYGGNNITHWSFLDSADASHPNIQVDRLCGKLFLITDKDGDGLTKDGNKSAKALRQEQLKEKLRERYYCLAAREIENTLSITVLKNTIRDIENNPNIEFKAEFDNQNKYTEKKIGTYLDSHIIAATKSYADQSGTVKDKLNFAKKAVSHVKKIEDLSSEALDLAEKLYEFIKKNN